MHRLIAAMAMSALLSGCVTVLSSTMSFDHPRATEAEFLQDRAECLEETTGWLSPEKADIRHARLFEECMAERGYTRNDAGRLVAPPAPPAA